MEHLMRPRFLLIIPLFLFSTVLFSTACERDLPDEVEEALPAAPEEDEESAADPEEARFEEAPADDPRREEAMAAIFELRDTLMGRVMSVASEEGFPAAVTVCKEEAIALTEEVAEKHGLALGRTSEQLRNPDNQPPDWFADLSANVNVAARFQEAETGELRGVAPIRLAAGCTNCHGATDQLAEGVPEALALHYPDDQATGYEEGDLRGYFWVEVPADR